MIKRMAKTVEVRDLARDLRQFPCFMGLTHAQLELLRNSIELHEYQAGEIIFNEGDIGDSFYAVLSGSVSIIIEGRYFHSDRELGHVSSGHFFGEMALLNETSRSATVRAHTAVKLLVIPRLNFVRLSAMNPYFDHEVRRISATRYLENVGLS